MCLIHMRAHIQICDRSFGFPALPALPNAGWGGYLCKLKLFGSPNPSDKINIIRGWCCVLYIGCFALSQYWLVSLRGASAKVLPHENLEVVENIKFHDLHFACPMFLCVFIHLCPWSRLACTHLCLHPFVSLKSPCVYAFTRFHLYMIRCEFAFIRFHLYLTRCPKTI